MMQKNMAIFLEFVLLFLAVAVCANRTRKISAVFHPINRTGCARGAEPIARVLAYSDQKMTNAGSGLSSRNSHETKQLCARSAHAG